MSILFLLLIIIALVQVPAVQTFITQKVTKNLAKQLNTEVSVGKVNLKFFETASIEDIYIEDQSGDTLIYITEVHADIGMFALFKQNVVIDELVIKNAYVNFNRGKEEEKFNYEFLIEAFAQPDTAVQDTTSSNFAFDLHQVKLENVRFDFVDDSSNLKLEINAPYLLADLKTLGLEEEHIKADNIEINDLYVYFSQLNQNTPTVDTDSLEEEIPLALDSALLNPSGFRYTVNKFKVNNSHVIFKTDTTTQPNVINFLNLDLKNIAIDISNFYLAGDTLTGELNQLHALEENSDFLLKNVALAINIELPYVSARLDEFTTANSRIQDRIVIEKLSIDPRTEDIFKGMLASADLKGAVLSMKDVTYFMPDLDTLPQISDLTAEINLNLAITNGKADIKILELKARQDPLYLSATGYATNLSTPDQLQFNVQINEFTTTVNYLKSLSFVEGVPTGVNQAGKITLIAEAKGSLESAELVAQLSSGLGRLNASAIYKAPTQNSFFVEGKSSATNFNLQPFVDDSVNLGNVSFTSSIVARGNGNAIDIHKFSTIVESLEYNNYTYKGLAIEGHFIDSVLEVATAYEDPLLDFDILLQSDLKDSLPLLIAEGNVDKANLFRLNLMADSIIVSTHFSAQVKGQTADNIVGYFKLDDTEVIRGARSYKMDSLLLTSATQPNGRREIELFTNFMQAEITGKYLFAEIPVAIEQCASYYCSAYKPTSDDLTIDQDLELSAKIWDEPAILHAFVPEFELLYPLTLKATLQNKEKSFAMELVAPGITYDSIVIKDLAIDAKTVDRVFTYDIDAGNIAIGTQYNIPQFSLDGKWAENSVSYELRLAPPTDSTHLLLAGIATFQGDTTIIEMEKTSLAIKGQDWRLAEESIFKLAPDYILVDNFTLQNNEQLLSINTVPNNTGKPTLVAVIDQFQVGDFMELAGFKEYKIGAILNGKIEVENITEIDAIEATLQAKNITIDSLRVGDLSLAFNKAAETGKVLTDIGLDGPGNELSIKGYINVEDSTDAIALDVNIGSLKLNPYEPLLKEFITDINGSLEGNLDVRGSLSQPVVDGALRFSRNSNFTLELTGARYTLEDESIEISSSAISLNGFTLKDVTGKQLVVDGSIQHQYFQNFVLYLSVNADNFQLVNKERAIKDPFFGLLVVAADASIIGPIDELEINADITVNDQTDFTIVTLDGEENVAKKDFINFVNTNAFLEEDTLGALPDSARVPQLVDPTGFTFNGIVSATPQSSFTVIVDPLTGDFLEVRGTADDIKVTMLPSGEMVMQGDFTVEDGRYRLSYLEVIQRNFDIRQGSMVSFNGDPLLADLNMTAVYSTEASRVPLFPDATEQERAQLKEKRPVDVILTMTGTLNEPVFSFDIEVPEARQGIYNNIVEQRLQQIRKNESALFKQIFGLIVLNRFVGENPLVGQGGTPTQAVNAKIDQTLSSFLTEQLSALTTDYLGVQLEVDVASQQAGEDAIGTGTRDVGFQLSRTFLDDRLQVKFGGTTAVGGTGGSAVGATGNSNRQFAGNFEIVYEINEKGNLTLTVYQRNDRNFITNEFVPKTGVAVNYIKSFESMRALFGNKQKENNQQNKPKAELLKSDGVINEEEK